MQTDEDDLMPFFVLDQLMYHFVQLGHSPVDAFRSLWPSLEDRYGGDPAAVRQAALTDAGLTGAEALAFLNLVEFDINGDDTFDIADITALSESFPTPEPTINSYVLDGPGNVTVQAGNLLPGKQYYLKRDTDLVNAPVFDVVVDSVITLADTATLTDTNAPADKAFYRITD